MNENKLVVDETKDFATFYQDNQFDFFVRGFVADKRRRKTSNFTPETVLKVSRYGFAHPLDGVNLSGRVWVQDLGVSSYRPQRRDRFTLYFEFDSDAMVFKLSKA